MSNSIHRTTIAVDGMTCASCERRIESALLKLPGVSAARASAPLSEVRVTFDASRVDGEAINNAIRDTGYSARKQDSAPVPEERGRAPREPRGFSVYQAVGMIAVIVALFLIIRYTVGFNFIPTVSQSMGFGLIFLVGLVTSLHCVSMCGGITLSQTIAASDAPQPAPIAPTAAASRGRRLMPALLYNSGRVISYTVIGGIAGAAGSVFNLSAALKGIMPVVAGAFMLFLGIRMLGVFPWLSRLRISLPRLRGRPGASVRRGPFIVGLLNGLLPCGPLQTMQVYALGTGSALTGALSMFVFSLGTVPLMFGFGAVSSYLSARFNKGMLKASGVLVAVLGLVMFTRGMNLFGVGLTFPGTDSSAVARIEDGVQRVTTTVDSGRYHPLIVQAGIPVRWTILVKAEDLNGCNNPVTVPAYGIRRQLSPGKNLIEFTPGREGIITYTCWMGMISSQIKVVADLSTVKAADLIQLDRSGVSSELEDGFTGDASTGAGCCSGASNPRFAVGCCGK
jgi:sulfite exporter TauE/SafE/copper chaperone CopZ